LCSTTVSLATPFVAVEFDGEPPLGDGDLLNGNVGAALSEIILRMTD
jgi:hypothetical protein